MKKTILLLLLVFSVQAFQESNDTTQTNNEITKLKEKVDSLEIALEKFSMEMLERNPIISGKYLTWGKGLTFGIEYPIPSVDIGYTLKLIRGTTRLGFSVGYDYRHGIDEEKNELSGFNKHFGHIKFMVGSPVFFNLMSISAGLSQLYAIDNHLDNTSSTYLTCTRLNFDFEFWVQPNFIIFLGLNTYLYDLNAKDDFTENQLSAKDNFNSDTFKVGVRYYLGSIKEKRSRRRQ